MEDLTTRALLVDPAEVDPQGVTVTVPRSEIQNALAGDDGPTDLILDVARFDDGADGESRRIAVEWERGDLERLLRQAEGDAIIFAFDRRSLELAFDEPDVEGHGLREKALILTVAAATAAGAAGAAKAVPDAEGLGASPGAAAYTAIESTRLAGNVVDAGQAAAASSGIEAARALGMNVADAGQAAAASTGIEAARAAEMNVVDAAAGSMGIEAARAAEMNVVDAAAGSMGIEAARAAEAAPDPLLAGYAGIDTVGAEVAAELGTGQAAAEYTGLETARATQTGVTMGGDTDGGTFAIETPSPAQSAALAGAAALAITGAAFMARSRRRVTPSN